MVNVFLSYSHADEALRDQLEKQLSTLKRQGVINVWHDRRIGAGENIDQAIDEHVDRDEIILLLISPDFINSDYCYDIEMKRALARHEAKTAVVIPVILRHCDWHPCPFGKLNATPRDGKPITSWPDKDEAFLQVAQAVRHAAEKWTQAKSATAREDVRHAPPKPDVSSAVVQMPRSSNLRLAKTFTQRDMDQFRVETFEYISRYFENSLAELGSRNPGYEGVFRRVDANRFFATIYQHGKDVARTTIYMGGNMFAGGIHYTQGETLESNTYNESLSVKADDQTMYWSSLGMLSWSGGRTKELTQEGAAELLWSLLIEHLQ